MKWKGYGRKWFWSNLSNIIVFDYAKPQSGLLVIVLIWSQALLEIQ
jgi:hypothetical protein